MTMQTTSHILMIRPVRFGYNAETAVNNAFQVAGADAGAQEKALAEFDGFVAALREAGVDIQVVPDTAEPHTPDSIFPNNWVSFHADGSLVMYPMFAVNRRLERNQNILDQVRARFIVNREIDLTHYENQDRYLEGTGSMVLDRTAKIAYACISPRTNTDVLRDFCRHMEYNAVSFHAKDAGGQLIYHTNVMMCVADRYVVICLDSITDVGERRQVEEAIRHSAKEIIPISLDQMNHFAGNMLQVSTRTGSQLLVMSSQAYASLKPEQIASLNRFNPILHAPLTTIETNGGGSARCMMAEIHLPAR